MIGLKRGTVKLVKYNSKWKESFEREAKKIKKILGKDALDIQHVGSTAIFGMLAKPIIDIIIVIPSLEIASKHIRQLKKIGYEPKKDDKKTKERLFFTKGPKERRIYYLHIGKAGSIYIKNTLLFRDYLIKHKNTAKKYSQLKKKLAEKYQDKREVYTKKKDKFIKSIIKKTKNCNMNLPEVKFFNTPLLMEADIIHNFLFKNDWGWSKYIIKKHPAIKRIFSLESESAQIKFLKKYIT